MASPRTPRHPDRVWTPDLQSAEAWAEQWQTPLYAYNLERAIAQIEGLKAQLGGAAQVWYALKANANRSLLSALRPHLDGADVASEGELRQALAAGFLPACMGYTGPAKSDNAHRAAIQNGVCVSVESLGELRQLADVAEAMQMPARLLLRINPEQRVHAFRVATGGVPSAFGLAEAEIAEGIRIIEARGPALQCDGVHVHAGSQCTSAGAWNRHAAQTLELAQRCAQQGLRVRRVNLGGGLGVAVGKQEPLNVVSLGKKLRATLTAFRTHMGDAVEVIMEPGRFLVAEAGCCLTRVVRRVQSRGQTVVVTDGGLNAFLFGTARFHDGPPPRVSNLTRAHAEREAVTLVGPSCTPLDTFGEGITVQSPQPGDLLALGPAGAYGFSASPHLFLGHDVPAEILREPDGAVRCIRPRRCLADFDA